MMPMPPSSICQTHIALALQLIALVSGILLINKAHTTDFFCKKTGKIIGGFVAIVSILSVLCIGYHSFKKGCCNKHRGTDAIDSTWQHPPFDSPMGMPSEPPAAPK